MNRFSKQVHYRLDLGKTFYLPSLDNRLSNYGKWAIQLRKYIAKNHFQHLVERILSIIPPDELADYLKQQGRSLPRDIYVSLITYIREVKKILSFCRQIELDQKGVYTSLVKGLDNPTAAGLLRRAVIAGYLDSDYQPTEDTTHLHLVIIAYGVSSMLGFKDNRRWVLFERQWQTTKSKLSSCVIPVLHPEKFQPVCELYPEVDFSPLINPVKEMKFDAPSRMSRVERMYEDLLAGRYIDASTTLKQFKAMFKQTAHEAPVNWIGSARQLSYFVHLAFGPTNDNLRSKVVSNFRVMGTAVNLGTFLSGYSILKRDGLLETYDPVLRDIAKRFNKKHAPTFTLDMDAIALAEMAGKINIQ